MVVAQKIDTDVIVLDYDCLSPSVIASVNRLNAFVVVVNNNLLQGAERRPAYSGRYGEKCTTPAPDTSNAEHTAHKKILRDLSEKIPNLCGYVLGDTSNFTIIYPPENSLLFADDHPNRFWGPTIYPICTSSGVSYRGRDDNFYPIDRKPRNLPNTPRGYAVQNIFKTGPVYLPTDKTRVLLQNVDKKYKCISDNPVFQQWAKNMKWQFSNTADILAT